MTAGSIKFFAGSRSDAFFFDFDGIKNLFDTRGKRNFTEPHLGGKSPWTGVDSNTESERLFNCDRAADERTQSQARAPHLGTMQCTTRRPVDSRRPSGPSKRQQLFQ